MNHHYNVNEDAANCVKRLALAKVTRASWKHAEMEKLISRNLTMQRNLIRHVMAIQAAVKLIKKYPAEQLLYDTKAFAKKINLNYQVSFNKELFGFQENSNQRPRVLVQYSMNAWVKKIIKLLDKIHTIDLYQQRVTLRAFYEEMATKEFLLLSAINKKMLPFIDFESNEDFQSDMQI